MEQLNTFSSKQLCRIIFKAIDDLGLWFCTHCNYLAQCGYICNHCGNDPTIQDDER
jgi:hypothetical protein